MSPPHLYQWWRLIYDPSSPDVFCIPYYIMRLKFVVSQEIPLKRGFHIALFKFSCYPFGDLLTFPCFSSSTVTFFPILFPSTSAFISCLEAITCHCLKCKMMIPFYISVRCRLVWACCFGALKHCCTQVQLTWLIDRPNVSPEWQFSDNRQNREQTLCSHQGLNVWIFSSFPRALTRCGTVHFSFNVYFVISVGAFVYLHFKILAPVYNHMPSSSSSFWDHMSSLLYSY